MDAGLDNRSVDLDKPCQRLLVLPRDHLGDLLERMLAVARVDALGTIAELEIRPALKAGSRLQRGRTNLFGHAGIDGALEHDDRPRGKDWPDQLAGLEESAEIRTVGLIDRRRHRDDEDVAAGEVGDIVGDLDVRGGQFLALDLARVINAALEGRNPLRADIEANDGKFAGKRHDERKPDIAKTDHRNMNVVHHAPILLVADAHWSNGQPRLRPCRPRGECRAEQMSPRAMASVPRP